MREWRNWQTRTFEGRVVTPYGFKSRFSHQKAPEQIARVFCFYRNLKVFLDKEKGTYLSCCKRNSQYFAELSLHNVK